VGLVIGKLSATSDRGQVYALIPTPPTEGGDPACSLRSEGGGGGREEKKKSGSKKPSNEAPQSVMVDGDWVAEHARQVLYAFLVVYRQDRFRSYPYSNFVLKNIFRSQECFLVA
jgi:Odorant response abnormal 4-like